jgi:MEDS: MEthanogen/methylotroph, DcmR Sensory domain
MTTTGSWEQLLGTPAPCDHFVQLYRDEAFLARAVVHFLGPALAGGEGVVVIATRAHGALFTERVAAAGFDVPDLVDRHQLVVLDAEQCLARFMSDGMPDRVAFFALVEGVLDRTRAAGFAPIRLYGEMVDLLWDHNLEATLELEALWNEVLADQGVSLLCAYRVDNFDRNVHRGVLHRLCRCHSHLIPVEDYARLDRAVERAYADVFGTSGDGATLRSLLMADYPSAPKMPSAQGALLALRQVSASLADAVLERARLHYEVPAPVVVAG